MALSVVEDYGVNRSVAGYGANLRSRWGAGKRVTLRLLDDREDLSAAAAPGACHHSALRIMNQFGTPTTGASAATLNPKRS